MTRKTPSGGLEGSLAALPAAHRRAVAQAIGAADASAGALARVLLDPDRLQEVVDGLPEEARAGVTKLAFAQVGMWSGGRQASLGPDILLALEQRGLAFCHRLPWGGADAWMAAEELLPGLRRARGRAHAARIPQVPAPADLVGIPDQILHDVAVVGAMIALGGVRLKADGSLYARARPLLLGALADLPHFAVEDVEVRLSLALEFLQQSGALRVAGEDLPGRAPRRELRLARDLVCLLAGSASERASLLDAHLGLEPEDQLCAPLLDALDGRTVTVAGLGQAVWGLVREAGYTLSLPPGVAELAGRFALLRRWLRGEVLLGTSADGGLTVTFSAAVRPAPVGPLCVAQGDFELVLLGHPQPHERAALLLLGETDPGREHVVRLTRERTLRATAALRALRPGGSGGEGDDPFVGLLRSLAGELPPNVERTVVDWIARAPRPARLRSAILVEVDAMSGDAAALSLGALVLERLGPGLLAVPADRLAEVEKALRKGGLELEPDLDRVSGRWHEDRSRYEGTDDWWRPIPAEEPTHFSPGPLRSGLADLKAAMRGVADLTQRSAEQERTPLFEIADPGYAEDEDDEDEEGVPGETILEAFESGEPIELRYAGAGGISLELVRVLKLDGARFRVRDLRGGGEHWRWVRAVLAARRLN